MSPSAPTGGPVTLDSDHYVTLGSDRGAAAAGRCPIKSGMTQRAGIMQRAGMTIIKEDGLAVVLFWWELRESNPRPSACKADALNQLS